MVKSRKYLLFILGVSLLLAFSLAGTAGAKSLYLVADHHTGQFDVWNINPDCTTNYLNSYAIHHSDPAGIACWAPPPGSPYPGYIFITSEFSSGIEIVDASTFNYISTSSGPSNLAGVAVDHDNNIVYALKRGENSLYAYDWDPNPSPSTVPDEENESEANNVFSDRNVFASSGHLLINGSLGTGGDVDIFEVGGLGSAPIDIEVISGGFDSILGLFNASGTLTDTDDDGGSGLLSRLSSVTPDSGTVRFGITGFSDFGLTGAHTETGSYQIAVGPVPSVPSQLTLKAGYPIDLPGCSGGYGIAYNELTDTLWVADGYGNRARAYNIVAGFWTEDTSKSFTPSHNPIDIVVDRERNFVYTTSMSWGAGGPGGSYLLSKYNLATSTETTVSFGDKQGVGVAVDEVKGCVYVTHQYRLTVWDTSTSPFTEIERTTLTGSAAGIVVPKGETRPATCLAIDSLDDGLAPGECVNPGDTVTYQVSWSNLLSGQTCGTADNATLVAALASEVGVPSSITGGGTYDSVTHEITWDLGDVLQDDPGDTYQFAVPVTSAATPGGVITTYCTIDSDDTNPQTRSVQTDVCPGGPPQVCDVNNDGQVDITDIRAILGARGTPASGPDDPADADGDGWITPHDATLCIQDCDIPGCAP